MKLKYFIRGLGIGIIFATVVMMIAVSFHTNDANTIKRAKKLGMVFQDNNKNQTQDITTEQTTTKKEETESSDSESTTESITTEKTEAGTTSQDNSEKNTTSNNVETEATTESVTTKAEEITTEAETTTVNTSKTATFTITSGMPSGRVAKLMAEKGIIDNATQFDNYLCSRKLEKGIRTGVYELPLNMTYEAAAKAITTR